MLSSDVILPAQQTVLGSTTFAGSFAFFNEAARVITTVAVIR